MMLKVCFSVAIIILIFTAVLSLLSHKNLSSKNRSNKTKWKDITPFRIIFGGCFASVFALMLPLIPAICSTDGIQVVTSPFTRVILAFHNTLQVFTVDVGAGEALAAIQKLLPGFSIYLLLMGIFIVVCPLMTLGFLLSFFHSFTAWFRLKASFLRERYIFSELNEKSLALASSIRDKHKKAAIVFTDVFKKNEETSYELIKEAKEINAICLKRDIVTLNTKPHSEKTKVYLFTIGENEAENVEQAVSLIDRYKKIENVELFVFSTRTDGELILTKEDRGKIKVRRINEIRSLVYRLLYEQGKEKVYDTAKPDETDKKIISAVIVGMGKHGTEMLKALTWFCQMDGYRLKINAFDKDEKAESKLAAKAPDLLSPVYKGVTVDGEAEYDIKIHSGIDVYTKEFYDEIARISDATYVFVSLGSDEENICASAELRMIFERIRIKPVIQTLVFNSAVKDALKGVKNFKGKEYEIDFAGDLKSSYSVQTVLDSDLENKALDVHKSYGGEEDDFWNYEYNYNSSFVRAVYSNICKKMNSDNSVQEHRRWNAYMRGEGYIYSGSTDKKTDNYLGKMHHDLVSYFKLPKEEKKKDEDIVG